MQGMQENKEEQGGWLASEFLSEDEKRRAVAHAHGIPFVVLERHDISPEALFVIPEPLSRSRNIVAYCVNGGDVEVALLDLADLSAIDFLQAAPTSWRIKPRLTDSASIKRALLLYQKHLKEKFAGLLEHGAEAADALLRHALISGASHVHIEPALVGTLVRYRIKGLLHEAMRLPEETSARIAERIKSLAKLFPVITTAQEGRFKFVHDGETVAVGVSTLPIAPGEKLTLRLAREHHGQKGFTLESLGLHGKTLERLHDILRSRAQRIAVVGPGGSGKTTLLYTILDALNEPSTSIATIESHVSYRLPHVAQMQARPEIGLTVAAGLRAVLRHDPDVVMIDEATLECVPMAASATARGMLVFAATQDKNLLSPSVLGATVELRTVKKLCQHCKTAYQPLRADMQEIEACADFGKVLAALKDESIVDSRRQWKELAFFAPAGCDKCEEGYQGLIGLQTISDPEGQCLTIIEDALFKAAQGLLSIEEVVEVASE